MINELLLKMTKTFCVANANYFRVKVMRHTEMTLSQT